MTPLFDPVHDALLRPRPAVVAVVELPERRAWLSALTDGLPARARSMVSSLIDAPGAGRHAVLATESHGHDETGFTSFAQIRVESEDPAALSAVWAGAQDWGPSAACGPGCVGQAWGDMAWELRTEPGAVRLSLGMSSGSASLAWLSARLDEVTAEAPDPELRHLATPGLRSGVYAAPRLLREGSWRDVLIRSAPWLGAPPWGSATRGALLDWRAEVMAQMQEARAWPALPPVVVITEDARGTRRSGDDAARFDAWPGSPLGQLADGPVRVRSVGRPVAPPARPCLDALLDHDPLAAARTPSPFAHLAALRAAVAEDLPPACADADGGDPATDWLLAWRDVAHALDALDHGDAAEVARWQVRTVGRLGLPLFEAGPGLEHWRWYPPGFVALVEGGQLPAEGPPEPPHQAERGIDSPCGPIIFGPLLNSELSAAIRVRARELDACFDLGPARQGRVEVKQSFNPDGWSDQVGLAPTGATIEVPTEVQDCLESWAASLRVPPSSIKGHTMTRWCLYFNHE